MRLPSAFVAVFCLVIVSASVAAGAPAPAAQAPASRSLDRPAEGFSLPVPDGWETFTDSDGAPGIRQTRDRTVSVVVQTLKQLAPADVNVVLADYLSTLFNDSRREMISQALDVFQGRAALLTDLQAGASRSRIVVVARDTGERSQLFYAVVATAPRASYGEAAPDFERITSGFRITPLAAAAAAELDRQAVLDRLLAPSPTAVAVAASSPGKDAKNRTQSSQAYDKALTFYRQGAWAEAEKEFRNAEKRDDDNVEYLLALGWVYNKLHRPNDALKRFDKVYKRNPGELRALVGLAATYEELQNYREAVRYWQRVTRAAPTAEDRAEASVMLRGAQDLFVKWYEIAENPGGGAKNLMSPQDELAWGKQVATQIAQSGLPELSDAAITRYVRDLCENLAGYAKNFRTDLQVHVIDNSTVNAITTPGYIFVFRGLLETADNEAELAGVLAHEIAHSVARHAAKEQTKAYETQQQIDRMKASDSKLSQFLAKLMDAGNASGQLSFSRENEEQADRIAVHLLYDGGYDPRGYATFFKKMESISPSSRKSWDLMQSTHPFSIDRLNTINAYADLLPEKPVSQSSQAFARMKAQLAKLPPPVESVEPTAAAPPAGGASGGAGGSGLGGGTTPFTMDEIPFAGEIPAGWGGRKTDAGTFIFEGPKGTESYEVSIEFGLEAKQPGLGIDQLAQLVVQVLSKKNQADVDAPVSEQAQDGTPVRLIRAGYTLPGQRGPVPMKHLTVILDYPGYYTLLSYYTPESIYQKYSDAFTLFLQKLRYTGR